MAAKKNAVKGTENVKPLDTSKMLSEGTIHRVSPADLHELKNTGRTMERKQANIDYVAVSLLTGKAEYMPPLKAYYKGGLLTVIDGYHRLFGGKKAMVDGHSAPTGPKGEAVLIPANPDVTLPVLVLSSDLTDEQVRAIQLESNAGNNEAILKDKVGEIIALCKANKDLSAAAIGLTVNATREAVSRVIQCKDETAKTLQLLANPWMQVEQLAEIAWTKEVKEGGKVVKAKERRFTPKEIEKHLAYIAAQVNDENKSTAGKALKGWKANEYELLDDGTPNIDVVEKMTMGEIVKKLRESDEREFHVLASGLKSLDFAAFEAVLSDTAADYAMRDSEEKEYEATQTDGE